MLKRKTLTMQKTFEPMRHNRKPSANKDASISELMNAYDKIHNAHTNHNRNEHEVSVNTIMTESDT